ncbi:MAG TPA: CHAT domain-containing protein, partial [Candidatus Synoicihabitans sp.]|nr:CHAT domain-containing protein [Candidatus Synoicihabitans sp.]
MSFAALIHPQTRRHVADTTEVVIAPTASAYVRLLAVPDVPRKSALVIGDPAFDRGAFPALEHLPSAAAEARDVAARYRSRLLLGTDATGLSVLSSITDYDVIHIAAHAAVANGRTDVLAFAFLAAGSRSAVGTLWDVDDHTTRLFSRRLHELLSAGTPVATAVRRVQFELRSRGFPVRTWG